MIFSTCAKYSPFFNCEVLDVPQRERNQFEWLTTLIVQLLNYSKQMESFLILLASKNERVDILSNESHAMNPTENIVII